MPNINTIAYQSAGVIQNTFATPTLTNTIGTTETAVPTQSNPFAAAAGITLGGGVIPLSVPAASQSVGYSNVASDIWISGRPFLLRAYGIATTGTSLNLTLKCYQVPQSILAAGTQSTLANDNVVASSSTFSVNGSTNFLMEAKLQWDSVSKRLEGAAKFFTNGALVAEAATTVVTTATANINELNFILSWTFGTANAANTMSMQSFEMEQV